METLTIAIAPLEPLVPSIVSEVITTNLVPELSTIPELQHVTHDAQRFRVTTIHPHVFRSIAYAFINCHRKAHSQWILWGVEGALSYTNKWSDPYEIPPDMVDVIYMSVIQIIQTESPMFVDRDQCIHDAILQTCDSLIADLRSRVYPHIKILRGNMDMSWAIFSVHHSIFEGAINVVYEGDFREAVIGRLARQGKLNIHGANRCLKNTSSASDTIETILNSVLNI